MFVPTKVWPTCGFVHPLRPYKWRSSQRAAQRTVILWSCSISLRTPEQSCISICRMTEQNRSTAWLSPLFPSVRRSAGGSPTSVSAGPDTKEATCSFGLKSGYCQTCQSVFVALVESQITPSCFCSQWPFFSCFRAQKANGSSSVQRECTPPITVHELHFSGTGLVFFFYFILFLVVLKSQWCWW